MHFTEFIAGASGNPGSIFGRKITPGCSGNPTADPGKDRVAILEPKICIDIEVNFSPWVGR
jgi:hypothetical protein